MKKSLHGKPEVAVVIPALNEEEAIGGVIDGVRAALQGFDYEIVVVDGNSTDRTAEIAEKKGVHVIYQRERGYGDAYRTGFLHVYRRVKAPITVMLDADGTYDPNDIPTLMKPIINGEAELVTGNRFKGMDKGAMSLTNRIGNKVLSWAARRLVKINVYDTQCGLRAFRTKILRELSLRTTGMPFALEMLVETKQARAKVLEVPVSYHSRVGKTKLNPIKDGLRILGVILRLARDYEPLLFFGGLGLLFILAGGLLGIEVIIEWLTTKTITRLARTVLSALLVMTGIQLFSLGLVADVIKGLRRSIREFPELESL